MKYIINPFIFEEWRYITEASVPGIMPNMYQISNFGRARSFGKRKMLLVPVETNNGYFRYNLRNMDGSSRYHLIHRIVMIEFNRVEGYESLQVNHKDGNKSNNFIGNLEWCTSSYNIQHAYDNGLKSQYHGDKCSWSTITNEQADQIGYLLTQNLTHKEISNITNCPLHIISNISIGVTWKDVFEKYNLKEYQRQRNKVATFSDDQLHLICKYFENNKGKYVIMNDLYRATLKELFDIEYNNSMSATMSRIYNKQTRKDITTLYDY